MLKILGGLLLLLGVLQLGVRGMQRVRSDIPMWDFVSVHAAAQTWMHGGNPYDKQSVVDAWRKSGIFLDRDVSYFATVYPPTSLLMLMPLAPLPAGPAMVVWLIIILVLLAFQFIALADLAGLPRRDPRVLLLVGGAVASAAMQFGILSGQLSLPAISLCIIAFWFVQLGRERTAGVLLALACAIKPQIAGPFILYYLVLRRWNVAVSAIIVGGAIGAISIAGMMLAHVDWYHGWKDSVALTTRIGAVNDYGWAGDFRDEIVDLKMLLISFLHDTSALRIAVLAIVAGLFAWYLRAFPGRTQRTARVELLALAGLSAILLLPVYHRVYDLVLLTTAFAWALAELRGINRNYAIGLIIPMLVFLIPFDIVRSIAKRSHQLTEISHSAFWQTWLAPHYTWGLLALTIGLLIALGRQKSVQAEPDSAETNNAVPEALERR